MLTRDEAIERLNEAFVVLATTNIRELPTEVELGTADGMPRACVLNADHVASLPKGYLGDLIATLDAERLARSAARWIAQPGADAPTCVLGASLRLEMSRIALQPQVRASLGISCIYGLFGRRSVLRPRGAAGQRRAGNAPPVWWAVSRSRR